MQATSYLALNLEIFADPLIIQWWVHGAGNSKVPPKALHGILDTMPVDYKWTMEFPLQVIGREVQINHNRAMT